jgi:hypothetical protein
MSCPLLEPARPIVAAALVFAALALGVGKPAWGDALVTEEQADAAAVAAREADDQLVGGVADLDARIVQTTIWSASSNESPDWFAALEDVPTDLTVSPSPMQPPNLETGATLAAQEAAVIPNEHAVIPLPSAAWTGFAGLASLGTIRARKAIVRFFFI